MSLSGPSRRAWGWSRGPLSKKGKRTKREISTTPPIAGSGDEELANTLFDVAFYSSLGSAKIHDMLRHCTMRLRERCATPLDNRLIAPPARHFAPCWLARARAAAPYLRGSCAGNEISSWRPGGDGCAGCILFRRARTVGHRDDAGAHKTRANHRDGGFLGHSSTRGVAAIRIQRMAGIEV